MNPYGSSTLVEAHALALIHARKQRIIQRMHGPRPAQFAPLNKSRAVVLSIISALALVSICAVAAFGQSTFGSIRGTVDDGTGAVIPGAAVTAHSLDENSERQTKSDASGEFVFENLKAGKYKITVRHDGFSDAVVASVVLAARQELRLPVTLSVSQQSTTVEVSADAAQINTENGTVSDSMSNEDITQLPMNSRAVSSSPLATLAISPSVVTDSQGNIAIGGATSAQTGFSVDGVSTANVRSNGALHDAYPSSEGIAETKVTAFNNNAEFAQIGDVTFTTKSGTNQWHGSAFEYFQNGAMDATIFGFSSKAPKNFNTFRGQRGRSRAVAKAEGSDIFLCRLRRQSQDAIVSTAAAGAHGGRAQR